MDIFRKTSLDRLSSPEKLDMLMTVTTPTGWLALTALGLILLAAVVWSFYGRIPTIVSGSGYFTSTGGISEVAARTNGQIYDIRIRPGDKIEAGQVVARVSQSESLNNIQKAKKELELLKNQYAVAKGNTEGNDALNLEYTEQQRSTYRKKIEDAKTQLNWLDQKIKDQEALLKDGLITLQELVTTKQQYAGAASDIKQYQSQIDQLSFQKSSSESGNREKLLGLNQQLLEKEGELQSMQRKYESSSTVVSPFTGQVIAVMSDIGSLVREETPVLRLTLSGNNIAKLSAEVYVPGGDSKLVRPGMVVQISPVFAKKDEYGYMEGRVRYVSTYSATTEEMMNTFHDKAMVDELSRYGAPLKVMVDLTPSSSSVSGIKWSSPRGNKLVVTQGTRFSASVIVLEQQPIYLIIPTFKKYLLGG